jgi:hypothetical protein
LIETRSRSLRDRLALDSSQQQMFEQARVQTLAARDQAIASARTSARAIDAELAKNEPDLAAVATLVEARASKARRRAAPRATSGSSSTRTCAPTRRWSSATRFAKRSPHADGMQRRDPQHIQQRSQAKNVGSVLYRNGGRIPAGFVGSRAVRPSGARSAPTVVGSAAMPSQGDLH